MGLLQEFNINELAGATGLMLGGLSGILVIIFKSRCYCKFRVGFTDNCNICMCERKPPPDPINEENTDEESVVPSANKNTKDKTGGKGEKKDKAAERPSLQPSAPNSADIEDLENPQP